ncbi:MAG: type II toxin-antitoxin system RelE/ParE family toxin [Candidatus Aenigmarchaeota archaeon]|nr:type II toxin-antitoxin system RelE/ParE family toxin [Candidatus Aenigmarchaeota archaeon]MCK5333721.1 type II toxin-antitoxin system RelE/ParE family toxin [Candidatus Aenigmarchaeota archaeon]
MAYVLALTEIAEERLRKLNKELQKRFFKKIEKLKNTPECGKPLRNVLAGSRELYFERKYRILYSIDNNQKLVKIESILHKDDF